MSQKSNFFKGVFFEQGKNAVALLTSLVYFYLIARLLGPSEYGSVVYFISFSSSILNMLGISFLQTVLFTFSAKLKSRKLFLILLKLQYVIILPIFLILWFFGKEISKFLLVENGFLLSWSAFIILLMPAYMSLSLLFKSIKNFGASFRIESLMQILNVFIVVVLIYFFKIGAIAVIWAQTMSVTVALLAGFYFYKKIKFENKIIDLNEIKKFSIYSFPNSLVTRFYAAFQTIMLGLNASALLLGYYYIIQKIIGMMVGLINNPIKEAIRPFVLEKYNDKNTISNFTSLTLKTSLIVTILITIFLTIFGKIILDLFLPEFSNAYTLIPFFGLGIITESFKVISQIFVSINEMKVVLKYVFITSLLCVPLTLVLLPLYNVYGALYVLISYNVIFAFLIYNESKKFNFNIEIIPRKKDFKMFKDLILKFISNKL